jgi:hypothetical protein
MTTYTKTGDELLVELSRVLGDYFASTTTAAGNAGGTTLEDSRFRDFPKNTLIDQWIRITSGTNDNEVRRITANDDSIVTINSAFTGQVATSVTYELHKWEPRRKWAAIDAARIDGFPAVAQLGFDETFTPTGFDREVTIPPTILRGPYQVWQEVEANPDGSENVLTNPKGDSLSNWTVAGGAAAATLYEEDDSDELIPKYDSSCTRITVPVTQVVTYTQVVGDMSSDITAAKAAGRNMTAAMWVYARVASRVTLLLIDDTGTVTTSSAHQGRGWELLTAEGVITGNNATTLSVQLSVSSGAVMNVFWNRAWLRYGTMPHIYKSELNSVPHLDASTQRIILNNFPAPRRTLRLSGYDYVSELGISTPYSNTVEVDDGTARLLAAFAAKALFREMGMSTDVIPPGAASLIASAENYKEELEREQRVRRPQRRLRSPWDK